MARLSLLTIIATLAVLQLSNAFTQPALVARKTATPEANTMLSAWGKKDKQDDFDLSSIESRDLTREEMLDINAQNEEIMNMELQMMTVFSVVLSLPIFYLCWVAFYSD